MRLSRVVRGEDRRIYVRAIGSGPCDICGHEPRRLEFTLGFGDVVHFTVCPRCASGDRLYVVQLYADPLRARHHTCLVCQEQAMPPLRFCDAKNAWKALKPEVKPVVCKPCSVDVLEVARSLLKQDVDAIDWLKPARVAP